MLLLLLFLFSSLSNALSNSVVYRREYDSFLELNKLRARGFRCPKGNYYRPNSTPLVWDCRAWKAAKLHSQDMAVRNYFDSTSLDDGRSPWIRCATQGLRCSGMSIDSGTAVNTGLKALGMKWDDQCNDIMNPKVRIFGVGWWYNPKSKWKNYWTMNWGDASQLSSVKKYCIFKGGRREVVGLPEAAPQRSVYTGMREIESVVVDEDETVDDIVSEGAHLSSLSPDASIAMIESPAYVTWMVVVALFMTFLTLSVLAFRWNSVKADEFEPLVGGTTINVAN